MGYPYPIYTLPMGYLFSQQPVYQQVEAYGYDHDAAEEQVGGEAVEEGL